MIFDGYVHQIPDTDPDETQEWLDSLDAVVDAHGKTRARYLLTKLLERAQETPGQLPGHGLARRTSTRSPASRSRGSPATSTSSGASGPSSAGTRR